MSAKRPQPGIVLTAIPGQPADPAVMPPDAPQRALAAVEELAAIIDQETFCGFLEPAIARVYYDPPSHILRTVHHNSYALGCSCAFSGRVFDLGISWAWGVLWTAHDWYEVGWHPDKAFFGLVGGDVRARLWDALNPGKRPPIGRPAVPRR